MAQGFPRDIPHSIPNCSQMSSEIRFFATGSDLLLLLGALEQQKTIKYVSRAGRETPSPVEYQHAAEIPDFGIASSESAVGCRSFLIFDRNQVVEPRPVAGGTRYAFDQLFNPDSVSFSPGGLWRGNILLEGSFGTAYSGRDFSAGLMKLLRSAIRKQFAKVKAYYLSTEAEAMLNDGKRLTAAEQCPREYDLSRI